MDESLLAAIAKLQAEIEKMSPNLKAIERLGDSEARFKEIDGEFDKARESAKTAKDAFTALKKKRCDLFNKAYTHISDRIDEVYKDLTKGKAAPMGGVAYLSLEDSEVRCLAVVVVKVWWMDGSDLLFTTRRSLTFTGSSTTRCLP
jgi:structural maintenance of chromosome 1